MCVFGWTSANMDLLVWVKHESKKFEIKFQGLTTTSSMLAQNIGIDSPEDRTQKILRSLDSIRVQSSRHLPLLDSQLNSLSPH